MLDTATHNITQSDWQIARQFRSLLQQSISQHLASPRAQQEFWVHHCHGHGHDHGQGLGHESPSVTTPIWYNHPRARRTAPRMVLCVLCVLCVVDSLVAASSPQGFGALLERMP
jgi:hypothetical protein